jgi:hypothetical protein
MNIRQASVKEAKNKGNKGELGNLLALKIVLTTLFRVDGV